MGKSTNGFTLIELLISMSLLATIMLLGTWSFSVFINKWEGSLGQFDQRVSQAKDYILLNDIITTIIPFVYNQNNKASYYFVGEESEFRGVTLGSIFHPNSAVAFRVQAKAHEDGSSYLLYQEGKLSVLSDVNTIEYTHEKVLMSAKDEIKMSYLGWQTAIEKINSEDSATSNISSTPQWRSKYNSSDSSLMPIAIKIAWGQSIAEVSLINDQGQWLTVLKTAGGINE